MALPVPSSLEALTPLDSAQMLWKGDLSSLQREREKFRQGRRGSSQPPPRTDTVTIRSYSRREHPAQTPPSLENKHTHLQAQLGGLAGLRAPLIPDTSPTQMLDGIAGSARCQSLGKGATAALTFRRLRQLAPSKSRLAFHPSGTDGQGFFFFSAEAACCHRSIAAGSAGLGRVENENVELCAGLRCCCC